MADIFGNHNLEEDMPLYVKPIRQKFDYDCGPTVIQMILSSYGIKASIDEISKIAGTTKESGTSIEGMAKAFKYYGLETIVKELCTPDDLRYYINQQIPVVVDWFSFDGGPGGHYSIIVSINKKNITLRDPGFTKIRRISIKEFMSCWFDYPGDYPKDKNVFIVRLMMVATPKKPKPEA